MGNPTSPAVLKILAVQFSLQLKYLAVSLFLLQHWESHVILRISAVWLSQRRWLSVCSVLQYLTKLLLQTFFSRNSESIVIGRISFLNTFRLMHLFFHIWKKSVRFSLLSAFWWIFPEEWRLGEWLCRLMISWAKCQHIYAGLQKHVSCLPSSRNSTGSLRPKGSSSDPSKP